MARVTASFVFNGFGDYFGGWGTEQGKSALLYAFYGANTTLRDIVDQLVDDVWNGPAGEDLPEDCEQDDVRAAIMDSLTEQGRADYESGTISEFSVEYAGANGLEVGADEEDDDCMCESPVVIFLIECEVCADCGKCAEHAIDDICEDCARKHGYDV